MKQKETNAESSANCISLFAFYESVAPFLRRLRHPKFDAHDTNDYICESTDCKNAIAALTEIEATTKDAQ